MLLLLQAKFPSTNTLQLKGISSTVQFYGAGELPTHSSINKTTTQADPSLVNACE